MKQNQAHGSLLFFVILTVVILLVVPTVLRAQDDKGPVGSFNANMATAAELLRLSSI